MSAMTEDQTYNGWKNYPTWAVNLWLDNERDTYERFRLTAQNVKATIDKDENVVNGIWTPEEAAKFRLADWAKEWVTEELAPDLGATVAADLLGYALGEVDWVEIAENKLSEE